VAHTSREAHALVLVETPPSIDTSHSTGIASSPSAKNLQSSKSVEEIRGYSTRETKRLIRLPWNVVMLGLTTLLTDVSSEMIIPLPRGQFPSNGGAS
jgi:hypothetical protein